MANLALICQNQGKYDEVEIYYQRALTIYQTKFGLNDSNVIKTKNNLALVFFQQEKYSQAEQLYKDILTAVYENERRATSNDEHYQNYNSLSSWYKTIHVDIPTVASTLKNLIVLYRRQDRHDAANILIKYMSQAREDSHIILQALQMLESV
jgi:kinesin light chain